MRLRWVLIAMLTAVHGLVPLAQAEIRCVSPAGGGCFTTIQGAIDATSPGDTIRVAEGTYTGSTIVSGATYNFYINKTITLEGGWNSTFTARDPAAHVTTLLPLDRAFSVVAIEGPMGNPDAVAPVIDGFNITGSDLGGNHGGGLRIRDSNAVVRNCEISGNQAFLLGGGVWVQRGGPRLENNRIQGNTVTGAGAAGGGVELENTQATLNGNTIIANTIASSTGYGGGVAIAGGGPVTLTSNTIVNNAAANAVGAAADHAYGGGVSVNSATVALTGNLIQGNSANSVYALGTGGGGGSGGGVYILNSASFTLTGNTISNNTGGFRYRDYLGGGGLYVDSSQGSLSDNVVSGNQSNGNSIFGNGAGVFATASTLTIQGGQITNNKVSRNCEGYGGGLYASSSTITVDATRVQSNCAANTASYGQGGGLALINSPFTLTNALITDNLAFANDMHVGGLFAGLNGTAITVNNSPGVLINDTIANNRGQGIQTASPLTLTNSIVMGHTTGVKLTAAKPVTATYNVFFNNGTNTSGFSLGSPNLLVDPQLDAGYTPVVGSPVVDAGTNGGCPATDPRGVPRPLDGNGDGAPVCDIGAHELAVFDLAVSQTAPSVVTLGDQFPYAITVRNLGPGPAEAVTVTDPLPAGVSLVSATPSQGSCAGQSLVTCTLGSLAGGATATITLVVTATSVGTLTHAANVTAVDVDSNLANNTTTAMTVVGPPPPLDLHLNATTFRAGDTLILTATLTPDGISGLVDAYVVLRLPDGSFLSLQLGGGVVPGIVPIARGFTPFPFSGELLRVPIPAGVPGGSYAWLAGLTEAGTGNVIGAIDQEPFTVTP